MYFYFLITFRIILILFFKKKSDYIIVAGTWKNNPNAKRPLLSIVKFEGGTGAII